MSFNIRQLEDRATDVDPDLRYMALEDLQKYLLNPKVQVRNVATFVPLSFRLLADSVSEVQNQSVRTFPLLIRHASDSDVLQIVEKLYDNVDSTVNDSTFSTSVPHLALRSIFNESSSRFQNSLANSVFSLLLPRILDTDQFTIDKVEILIDLLRNLGHVLSIDAIARLVDALADKAFLSSGIVGKRSIVGIDECLELIGAFNAAQKAEIYDNILIKILAFAGKQPAPFFTLTQVILNRAQKSLSTKSIDLVFDVIVKALCLDSLVVSLDELDVDRLIELNQMRETCLLTMSLLTACVPSDCTSKLLSISNVAKRFLTYDPFNDQDDDESDSYVSDFDSDFDFDDDEIEQFEGTGENDALAAKLRLSALINFKSIIIHQAKSVSQLLNDPVLHQLCLLVGDKVDFVSDESIQCCVLALGVIKAPSSEILQLLEQQLFSLLLTQKNIVRFNTTKPLIEALIGGHSKSLSETFLSTLHGHFLTFKISMKSFSDIARLYKVILEEYTVPGVPVHFLDFILGDVDQALSDPNVYHNLLSEVLLVLQILYRQSSNNSSLVQFINSNIFPKIVEKISNRQYPSDLRQALLRSLTEIVLDVPLVPETEAVAVDVYLQSLAHEVSMKFTLECLIQVLITRPHFLKTNLQNAIMQKTVVYLKSSDSSLYMPSLTLLDVVLGSEQRDTAPSVEPIKEIKAILLDMVSNTSETSLINACFSTLRHTTRYIPADEGFFRELINSVINIKLVDVDNINIGPIEELIETICESNSIGGERILEISMQSLVFHNFISAKMMSILVFKLGLIDEIKKVEEELLQIDSRPIDTDKVIFDIHFLGCVSSRHEIKSIQFNEFFTFLNSENEQIALAAARALGLLILRDFDHYLPTLLSYYHDEGMSEQKKILILVAIKQVLKETTSKYQLNSLREIWGNIIDVLLKKESSINSKKVSELKLAGDILSKIVELDTEHDYQQEISSILDAPGNSANQHLIYTLVVIVKQLMNKALFAFNIENIKRIVQFLTIANIELKSAIISTLLTGIYNKIKGFAEIIDDVILPRIYDELTAKEEFKKVIPMGPYKYVIDEGLEVRKLGYEFINAVVSVNNDRFEPEFNVDVNEVKVFEVLCSKGLKDSQNDIINSTINILMQMVQKDENVLMRVSNLGDAVASLSKIINRKLRAKASTQESESHEDTLRNVIKLSKVISDIIKKNNNAPAEWATFYYELQNKHQLLFNSV